MIHRLAAALALVAIGISMPVAPAPVHAARWADGPCTDNVGITIVIDFQELDSGGPNVRCAAEGASSGLDALDKAGILWEGTRRFPGVVCRIAGKPGVDTEPCGNTPPATAYWSYWVAPRGGSWCYSSAGAGNRTPPPGTIEGWSFAKNRVAADIPPPRYAPPPPIAGEAPNPLNGADCGSPAAPNPPSPTPPSPTAAPTIPPPAPTNAPGAPPTSTVLADPDSASTVVSTPSKQTPGGPTTSTAAAANAAAPTSTTGAASASTTSAVASTTTRPPTTSTGDPDGSSSTDAAGAAGTSVPLGTVDLSDDGRGDGGFSPAAGLGILIAAGVGGASVWAARRRRGMPP